MSIHRTDWHQCEANDFFVSIEPTTNKRRKYRLTTELTDYVSFNPEKKTRTLKGCTRFDLTKMVTQTNSLKKLQTTNSSRKEWAPRLPIGTRFKMNDNQLKMNRFDLVVTFFSSSKCWHFYLVAWCAKREKKSERENERITKIEYVSQATNAELNLWVNCDDRRK